MKRRILLTYLAQVRRFLEGFVLLSLFLYLTLRRIVTITHLSLLIRLRPDDMELRKAAAIIGIVRGVE